MSIAYNTQNSLSQVSLWEAAGANNGSKTDINRLRELLAQGEDINQPNWAGCTPLHCAAPEGNVEVLKFLLDYRADCNRTTPYGLTPLHFASYYGRLDNVKLLLNYGANPSTRTHDGFTPKDKAVEGQKNARGKPQDGLRHAEVIDLLSAWENQGRIPQTTSIPLTSTAQHVQPPSSTDYFATFVRSLESVINKHRQTQSAVYGRQKDDDFKVFLQEISNLVQTYHQATQQQPQQPQPQIQQPIHSFQPPVTNENAWGINGPQSLVASSLHRPPSTPQIQPTGAQPPRNQQVNPQRPPQNAPPTTPITNNLPPTKPSVPPRNPASTPGPGAIVPYENPNQPNMTTPDYYTQQYHAFLENIKAGPRGGTVFAGDYYNQGGQSARVFPHTNNSAYAQYSPAGPARTQAPTWINQSYTPPQSSFGFPSAPSYQNFAYSQYSMPGLQGMQGMGLQATPQRF